MPELPEVETVRRGLEPVLSGARLSSVRANRPDLRFPLPDGFVQRLTGARILRLDRRAKYILAPLDRGDTLVMHLGMTGRFEIAAPEGTVRPGDFAREVTPDDKHAHVVFQTEEGATVTYYDPRRFGFMDIVHRDGLLAHAFFKGLGEEPTGNVLDDAYLANASRARRSP